MVELERLNTFKLMLEKEQQFVETKRSELTRSYNPPGAVELANAEKRVRELQQKYNQMAHRLGLSASESQPQVCIDIHVSSIILFQLSSTPRFLPPELDDRRVTRAMNSWLGDSSTHDGGKNRPTVAS